MLEGGQRSRRRHLGFVEVGDEHQVASGAGVVGKAQGFGEVVDEIPAAASVAVGGSAGLEMIAQGVQADAGAGQGAASAAVEHGADVGAGGGGGFGVVDDAEDQAVLAVYVGDEGAEDVVEGSSVVDAHGCGLIPDDDDGALRFALLGHAVIADVGFLRSGVGEFAHQAERREGGDDGDDAEDEFLLRLGR